MAYLRQLFGLLRNPCPYQGRIKGDKREIKHFSDSPVSEPHLLHLTKCVTPRQQLFECISIIT